MEVVTIEQRLVPPEGYEDEFFYGCTQYIRFAVCATRHPGDWPPREMGQRQLRNAKES